MRIVKDAAARRSEILDAAEKLFGTKGYDATSTVSVESNPSSSKASRCSELK